MLFTSLPQNPDEKKQSYALWTSARCVVVLSIGILTFIIALFIAGTCIFMTPTALATLSSSTTNTPAHGDMHTATYADAPPPERAHAVPIAIRLILTTGGSVLRDIQPVSPTHGGLDEQAQHFRILGSMPTDIRAAYFTYPERSMFSFLRHTL